MPTNKKTVTKKTYQYSPMPKAKTMSRASDAMSSFPRKIGTIKLTLKPVDSKRKKKGIAFV